MLPTLAVRRTTSIDMLATMHTGLSQSKHTNSVTECTLCFGAIQYLGVTD